MELMKKFWNLILLLSQHLSGDFAYKAYVEASKNCSSKKKILDRKTFLQNRQKAKWSQINRCC